MVTDRPTLFSRNSLGLCTETYIFFPVMDKVISATGAFCSRAQLFTSNWVCLLLCSVASIRYVTRGHKCDKKVTGLTQQRKNIYLFYLMD